MKVVVEPNQGIWNYQIRLVDDNGKTIKRDWADTAWGVRKLRKKYNKIIRTSGSYDLGAKPKMGLFRK